jgi:hypothetical protein
MSLGCFRITFRKSLASAALSSTSKTPLTDSRKQRSQPLSTDLKMQLSKKIADAENITAKKAKPAKRTREYPVGQRRALKPLA